MLKENQLTKVQYTKKLKTPVVFGGEPAKNVEVTERVIIPTFVPRPKHQNVKAVDVTDLSEELREEMESMIQQYNEYLENQRKTLFTFEDFVAHTRQVAFVDPVKWRTFKPDQLEEL